MAKTITARILRQGMARFDITSYAWLGVIEGGEGLVLLTSSGARRSPEIVVASKAKFVAAAQALSLVERPLSEAHPRWDHCDAPRCQGFCDHPCPGCPAVDPDTAWPFFRDAPAWHEPDDAW